MRIEELRMKFRKRNFYNKNGKLRFRLDVRILMLFHKKTSLTVYLCKLANLGNLYLKKNCLQFFYHNSSLLISHSSLNYSLLPTA